MTLLARSQAGVQLPQGRPVSLWGEPFKGRVEDKGKWERKLLSQHRTGREGGRNTARRSLRWGGKAGALSVL